MRHTLCAITAAWMLAVCPPVVSAQQAGIIVEGQATAERDAPSVGRIFFQPYVGGARGGAWGFVYFEKDYVSAVGGPYVTLFQRGGTSFDAGAGAGLARFPDGASSRNSARYAWSLTLEGPRGKTEFYYENGETHDRWIQMEATVRISPALAAGFFHQTTDGSGARVLFAVPATPFQIWGGPMSRHREGQPRALVWLVGADLTFGK